MPDVIIIGGGIIGLCSAYYLQKEGFSVTVIERGDITDGCSFGNMGFISPSHFIPLASPGIIAEGFRHMFRATSPFYIKPRLDADLFRWAYHFWKSSNKRTVDGHAPHLNNILQLSRELLHDLASDIGAGAAIQQKGCLMMCSSENTRDHEFSIADAAEKFGLRVERLDPGALRSLEPLSSPDLAGAVLYKDDCHFNPGTIMTLLKTWLLKAGVHFQLHTTVTGFEQKKNTIHAILTDKGTFSATTIVIAAGSWLPGLASMMGIKLLLQPGKGYSYTYPFIEKNIGYPAILVDGRCAISPWGEKLRIGGTMELSGINNKVLVKRMQGIYDSVRTFYPGLELPLPPAEKIWTGLRPVTPDGLPYIGRTRSFENVVFAGGHAMLGISQSTGTGKLVTEIVTRRQTSVDISAFDPQRF